MKEKEHYEPITTIELDCVPKDIDLLRQNYRILYDFCNEHIKDPSCFYTPEEIERIKKDKKYQKEHNIRFI